VLLLVRDSMGRFPLILALPGLARVFKQRGCFAQGLRDRISHMTSVISEMALAIDQEHFSWRPLTRSIVTVQKVGSIQDLNRRTWSCRHWLRQYAFQR
jgi:hypothetical protein